MKPSVESLRSNSAPSCEARAQSSNPAKCSSRVFVPRCVTRTSRSFSCENSVPLKSVQKSPTVLVHSSSAALTVKLRFTWPASLRENPPARAQTARKSSVCRPRCSVWKLTSLSVVSMRMGGIAPTKSCANQYAPTCCSKVVPAPPVAAELDTRTVTARPRARDGLLLRHCRCPSPSRGGAHAV
jgi:hypothetical protein